MSNETAPKQQTLQVRDDAGQPLIFNGGSREACVEALRTRLCEIHDPKQGNGCFGLTRANGSVLRISAAVQRKRGQGFVITHYTLLTWKPSDGPCSIIPSWLDGWSGPFTYQQAIIAFSAAVLADGPHWLADAA